MDRRHKDASPFYLLFFRPPQSHRNRPKSASKALGQGLPLPRRRAHSALQRGTWGVPGPLMHERLFFQSEHLLMVAMIHGRLDRQDGVQVVAILLHAMSVNVGGILDGMQVYMRYLLGEEQDAPVRIEYIL